MPTYQPDTIVRSEVFNRFEHHALKKGQSRRLTDLKDQCGLVAQLLLDETPACREQSLALQHLEEAYMWMEEAVRRNE